MSENESDMNNDSTSQPLDDSYYFWQPREGMKGLYGCEDWWDENGDLTEMGLDFLEDLMSMYLEPIPQLRLAQVPEPYRSRMQAECEAEMAWMLEGFFGGSKQ